ncbi:immunoglobulin-like domain-containing protein, partial [Enterococcus villorum]|uniref:immunoglobulin-like domain-containing protein n=1 Tax=Enterococcus villorum TaxID=112904 RepID=UPI0009BE3DDA
METMKKKKKRKNYVRKVVSASTAGLILFSTVSSPVLSYAETILGEKKAASTQETNAGPKESLTSELEKATSKTEEKTKPSEENATVGTTEKSTKVTEDNEAITAVQNLYEDEEQTIVKKDLIQETIDEVREKVNALPDSEEKTRLLAKVDQAFEGLQEIQLRGIEDFLFSRITVTKGKLVVRTQAGYPHYRLDILYSSIQVTRNEETVYSKEYKGTTSYPASQDEVNLQNGDIVTIMKKEPDVRRYVTNHPELKPNESGNYTYIVQDGLLIEASDKVLKEAQAAVKGLYENEEQTIVKKDLIQETVDEAREKVNALPDGEEKTRLVEKIDQAFNGLQEIQLRGGYDKLFSRITVTNGKLLVRTSEGVPHFNWGRVYATVQVTRGEESIYSREYVGTTSYQKETEEIDLQNGDIVTITKEEANGTRFIVNHPELKPNNDGNYAYLVQDGLLVDQSVAYTAANTAVNNLFEGEEPKETNTQEQIDDARTKVNVLLDSPLKQQLLAKVDQAQKLFDSLVGSLTVEDFQLLGSDRYIRGTFSGNIDYLRLEVNGVSYAKSTVKGESFQYYAVDKIKSPTDQVFLVGYNKDNLQVDRQQVNVLPVQGALSEVSFTLNSSDRYIEGSYTGKVDHIRLEVNGELKAKAGVSGNNFRYYAVDKIKNVADQVSLIAYDQNGNEIDRKEVTIHNALVGTIQTDPYVLGNSDRYIHGTYTGDVDHVRLEVNGELKAKAGVSGNKFRYYAVDKIDNMNDKVNIIAYDAKGNVLDKQPVTIETARKGTITPNEYKLGNGDNYLRGEYTGEVYALRLEVNGKLFARSVPGNSPFKYYAVDKIKNLTDEVYLIAYDNADIEIAREKINVVKEQTIHTTERPTGTLNAGINMGNGHDRQDLGIQLERGSKIKIKQVNPNYNENMNLRLLANGSNKESSISFGKNEVTLEAKDLTVPFVYTPYHATNMEKPVIQVTVEGTYRKLPVFDLTTEQSEFNQTWNLTNGYALVKGNRFQTLFPEQNKTQATNSNLRSVVQMYDNDILGKYDEWIGLSPDASNPIHKSSPRRYFFKADANGPGALYYGGSWSAQTSSSADAWLTDGWGVLHEIGHGYQGSFMSRGMNSGEVWNNIYGVFYQYEKFGKEQADRTGWLYDQNKQATEQQILESILQENPSYQNLDVRKQLLILSNLIDKSGNEGFKNFYVKYRELANQPGFNANNYPLPDLLVNYLGETKKYDLSQVLNAWGLTVKEETRQQVKEQKYTPVAHLAQVVPNDKLSEAIEQFTQENRLSSVLSLVTNDELKAMNLTSDVTLNFTDEDLFDGVKLRIMDGDKLYQEVTLNQGEVTLENIPNGVYSLELQTDIGYLKKPYIFVKENGTINISLTSYLKEATEAVANLFQENSDTKVKATMMQKDI